MANGSTNSKVISKANAGFPSYLDFDKLRSASIEYLSELTGKIWTDYNVHDPGITILEMLIYAMLDLGYRTNLPAVDIFTKNPADKSPENNFFTPAEILGCNPLTITDFRKLLIDIDGVKNAWLTVADDINLYSICKPGDDFDNAQQANNSNSCKSYINGLYHICIEKDDALTIKEEQITNDIKSALQLHRSLCEDFVDITFLCELDIGVCADIALETNADAEEIYRNIVTSLKEFFSPSPVFYSLQQLLDKKKPIEDIFAGRPYNYMQSHGFVDTDEFEAITLKNEIHLSDVYNNILGIDGVKTVRSLKLRKRGDTNFSANWQYKLPEKYVPAFATDLSSFNFTINGIYQDVDIQKNDAYLAAAVNSGKLLQQPDALNLPIPKSVYHNDLAEYYSIQNEFPLVYGIGEGGLPDSASPQRKAQALQLKAYLLFFDQLFANYLAQLKNIRSLFSFRKPATEDEHTYFTSQLNTDGELNTVPDFSKLIINITNKTGGNDAGNNGTIIAWPVWKKGLQALLEEKKFKSTDIKILQQQFTCATMEQCEIIINNLQSDFCNALSNQSLPINTEDNFFGSYILFEDEDVALTTNLFSKDAAAADSANKALQLLRDVGSLTSSYTSFISEKIIGFNVQLNAPTYIQFLQQVAENKDLYATRRDAFLNHILSRFAEQFTDYAMLSVGFLQKDELAAATINNKEAFLSNYPELSSTRGKAFDYTNANDVASGFEKRFKAYTGIENTGSLCNFEVKEYADTYSVQLKIAGFHLFDTPGSHEGLDIAQSTAQSVFKSAANAESYQIKDVPYAGKYQLQLLYNNNQVGSYPYLLNTINDAEHVSMNLQKMFALKIADEDIIVSGFEYRLQLKDGNEKVIRLSVNTFENSDDAFAAAIGFISAPSDADKWQIIEQGNNPSGKFSSNSKKKPEILVDTDYFKIDVNNNIVGKPDKFNYELLDKENTFKIRSLNEFNNQNQARTDCYKLLLLMTDINNYKLIRENRRNRLYIVSKEKPVAECVNRLESEVKAKDFRDKIYSIIHNHFYTLSAQDFPNRWKFRYKLGYEKNKELLFTSNDEFTSKEDAIQAAEKFNASLATVMLEVINDKYTLVTPANTTGVLTCTDAGEEFIKETDNNAKLAEAKSLLALRQKINEHLQSTEELPFDEGIDIDEISEQGRFVYRLVDKERLLAQHAFNASHNPKETLNNLYNSFINGNYSILNICLGGDITEIYTDPKTKATSYRYIIKCNNDFGLFKKNTVLFKSVAAYASSQDAETAFNANYLLVLGYAADNNNYGENKYISLDEHVKADSKIAVAFIPKKTQEIITGANTDIITVLVQTTKAHPIKTVLKCSSDFKILFPLSKCETDKYTVSKYVYYFTLYNKQIDNYDWQSVKYSEQIVEIRKDFSFFILLLLNKGNYTLQQDYRGNSVLNICHGEDITEVYTDPKTKATSYRYILKCSNDFGLFKKDTILFKSVITYASEEDAVNAFNANYLLVLGNASDKNNYGENKYISLDENVKANSNATVVFVPQKTQEIITSANADIITTLVQTAKANQIIYIREVLAESTSRFKKKEDAWGAAGIEKFICTTQAGNSFNAAFNQNNCSYNFNVACNSAHAVHPCKYNTAASRDVVIDKLHKAFKALEFDKLFKIIESNGAEIIYATDGKPLAVLFKPNESHKSDCERIIEILELINNDKNYHADGDKILLGKYNDAGTFIKLAKPAPSVTKEQWKEQLLNFAYYYPIKKQGEKKYCIEIRLPRFNTSTDTKPCECYNENLDNEDECYVAWQGACCFDNCNDAIEKFESIITALGDYQNYFASFDCECYSFGIELLTTNDIAAYNPQQYATTDMVCDAIERSKKLINSEGLRLVEHILLRPRCEKDCKCELKGFTNKTKCNKLFWTTEKIVKGEDEEVDICFVPGMDPYSFIATAVLPAWPERFRKKENRDLLETILNREIPSHILLRILWLKPQDVCSFETLHEDWRDWLSQKAVCDTSEVPCTMKKFLFSNEFHCLDECTDCLPCAENNTYIDCDENINSDKSSQGYQRLENMNDLFGWKSFMCKSLEKNKDGESPTTSPKIIEDQTTNTAEVALVYKEMTQEEFESYNRAKTRFVNARLSKYKKNISHIYQDSNENPIAGQSLRVLSEENPAEKINVILNELLSNQNPPKKKQLLIDEQKDDLYKNLIWFYIDKILFAENDVSKINLIADALSTLRQNNFDMQLLFTEWTKNDVDKYATNEDIDSIRKTILNG